MQDCADHFGCEIFAFHTGHSQEVAQFAAQVLQALRDDGLDARRQVSQSGDGHLPAAHAISNQIAAFLQAAQQFDCEQWVAAGQSE